MKNYYIGIDIGGTKCAVLAGTTEVKEEADRAQIQSPGVKIVERIEIPTDHTAPAKTFIKERLIVLCRQLIEKYGGKECFSAIGISCGGPLDDNAGVIYSPPNLPGWDAIPVKDLVTDALGIPAFLQNDANACALAEWRFGAGRGSRNMVFLTFGTGLGAGLILDRKLYSGTNGMAGEAGHIRLADQGPIGYGKEGSFEGFCSGGGIKHLCQLMAKEQFGKSEYISIGNVAYPLEEVTAKIVFSAARQGDAFAASVVKRCGEYLGRGLSVLIDILNPECIVLGSIFVRAEDLLRETMEQYLQKETLPEAARICRVVPAQLGEAIGDIAALSVAVVNGG